MLGPMQNLCVALVASALFAAAEPTSGGAASRDLLPGPQRSVAVSKAIPLLPGDTSPIHTSQHTGRHVQTDSIGPASPDLPESAQGHAAGHLPNDQLTTGIDPSGTDLERDWDDYLFLTILGVILITSIGFSVPLLWRRSGKQYRYDKPVEAEKVANLAPNSALEVDKVGLLTDIRAELLRARTTTEKMHSDLSQLQAPELEPSTAGEKPFDSPSNGTSVISTTTADSVSEKALLAEALSDLKRLGGRLWLVQDTAGRLREVENTKSAESERKIEPLRRQLCATQQMLTNLEQELLIKDEKIQEKDVVITRLRQENELAAREREEAKKLRTEVTELINAAGLPTFVNGSEEGAHFDSFLEFMTDSHKRSPAQVTRLQLMLRVFAAACERDDSAFELYLSVHEIGKSLYALMRTSDYDQTWQYVEASAWARALHKEGQSRFSIFIPIEKATFNSVEMVGGSPDRLIQTVESWGVRNKTGNVERRAIVR
jgi:hypothetical protein